MTAIDQYELACSCLGDATPPAFHIYCLCAQGNLFRELGEWDSAEAALSKAREIAEEKCPDGHALRAHVYERLAWFYMDRWNVAKANDLFGLALAARQGDLLRGNIYAQPFVLQNLHGQLTSYRYLAEFPTDEIDQRF